METTNTPKQLDLKDFEGYELKFFHMEWFVDPSFDYRKHITLKHQDKIKNLLDEVDAISSHDSDISGNTIKIWDEQFTIKEWEFFHTWFFYVDDFLDIFIDDWEYNGFYECKMYFKKNPETKSIATDKTSTSTKSEVFDAFVDDKKKT